MEMTDNNLQQAFLPEGCVVLENTCGTAPGCAFEAEGKHVIMLPGPPRECRAMLKTGAIPYLSALSDSQLYTHNIHVFGMGESSVEARLRDLMMEMSNPTLAPYAKDGEVLLRLTAKAHSKEEAEAMMAPALEKVRAILGDAIYGIDTDSLEHTVLQLLREQKKTVAVAESCTGGLLSKRLTDLAGSSAVFLGGITSYATQSKTTVLGVPEDVLKNNPVASRPVAEAMAKRAREVFGAHFGIGITGVAGPDADEDGTEPGTVFIALSTGEALYCREPLHFTDRARVRDFAASTALDMLRRYLTGRPV
jgi:nicotinamide-nucleotide amidase